MSKANSFWYRNGLSIVLLIMMIFSLAGQFITGWKVHNEELSDLGLQTISAPAYFTSGHFLSSTFENWESEFLQMGIYVILTVWLRQKGSAESKKLKGEKGADQQDVDRQPKKSPDAPWPVRKGGWWLTIYEHSLLAAFTLLFLISFILHFKGSLIVYNEEQAARHLHILKPLEYFQTSNFWFESFQNWQSEFLAVASIVLLSVWLRQKGSPQSKPVDAPHSETGT